MARAARHNSEVIAPGGARAWLCRHGYKYDGVCRDCYPLTGNPAFAKALADTALKPEDILGPINIEEMVQTKSINVAYIDGSGSTTHERQYFQALAVIYQSWGWRVFEFASAVQDYRPNQFQGTGTYWPRVRDHMLLLADSQYVQNVHILTDEDDVPPLPLATRVFSIKGPKSYLQAEQQIRQFMHKTPDSITPKAEEASMTARPSVITTVSLSQAENIVIADLKSLITEVERVGGDDTAQVRLNQSAFRWDVTLSVKANEVEPEPETLSPEEGWDLLTEYKSSSTTKARKAEIKKALGL